MRCPVKAKSATSTPSVAIALALLVAAGCAAFVSKREYSLFREITETGDPYRLVELYVTYVRDFPKGAYSDEIAAMRPEIEREIFMAAGEDRVMLARYVEIFPDGTYVLLAQAKIASIDAMIKRQEEQTAAIRAAQNAAVEAQGAARQALIGAIRGAFVDWVAIAGIAPYGMSLEALAGASPRFAEVWALGQPAACDATSCVKRYAVDTWYLVQGGTRVDRRLDMVVKIVLDGAGGILGFSVSHTPTGVLPLLELADETPYESDAPSIEAATVLVTYKLDAAAQASLPGGTSQPKEGTLWSYTSGPALLDLVRQGDPASGLTDSLLVQLQPPPPPPPLPVPGQKKPKKSKEPPPPPPPVASWQDLLWTPPVPPATSPAPVVPIAPVQPQAPTVPGGGGAPVPLPAAG